MAAGMGSRYGGLKQLDGLGPNSETIMDYSVFDALRAGFGKIVFVIRKDFEADFREKVLSKYADKVPCEVCFQAIDKVPEGCTFNPERAKPWGTNHAVLMAKDIIHEPFAVINADDFYGKESFQVLADYLRSIEGTEGKYCMVGYRVANTLSENGAVSRGVCTTDADGLLTDVVERTKIEDKNGTIVFTDEQFQQSTQSTSIVIWRLHAVLQIGKAGLAGPGMGIIKIRTVVQCTALEHHGIALFADDGGCQRPDDGQVRMIERCGKRHAVDVLRILLNAGSRDRQLRHLRMIEQNAIHVYTKKAHGQPSFTK